jgi:hypothetical protein
VPLSFSKLLLKIIYVLIVRQDEDEETLKHYVELVTGCDVESMTFGDQGVLVSLDQEPGRSRLSLLTQAHLSTIIYIRGADNHSPTRQMQVEFRIGE